MPALTPDGVGSQLEEVPLVVLIPVLTDGVGVPSQWNESLAVGASLNREKLSQQEYIMLATGDAPTKGEISPDTSLNRWSRSSKPMEQGSQPEQ